MSDIGRFCYAGGQRSLLLLLFTSALTGFTFSPTFAQNSTNQPPMVALTNPPDSFLYEFGATVRLKATASDLDGNVVLIQFYDSTNLLGSVTEPPYDLFLTNILPLNYFPSAILTAVATDNQGATTTSAPPVRIFFSQSPRLPVVSIAEPNDGTIVRNVGAVTVKADVVDYLGGENYVKFFADGNLIGRVAPPPYVLTITNLAPGDHVLTAKYTDDAGNTGVSPDVHITIQPFSLLSPRFLGAGQFGFTIQGLVTGNWFQVETSSNLMDWLPLLTNTAASSTFFFSEPVAPSASRRFYRAMQPSP